jgi:hypothetical protein
LAIIARKTINFNDNEEELFDFINDYATEKNIKFSTALKQIAIKFKNGNVNSVNNAIDKDEIIKIIDERIEKLLSDNSIEVSDENRSKLLNFLNK